MVSVAGAFNTAREIAKTIGFGIEGFRREWDKAKEEGPDVLRAKEIFKNGIDFNNPGQDGLDAAEHISRMIRMRRGAVSWEDCGFDAAAVGLSIEMDNATFLSRKMSDGKRIDFVNFAKQCTELCFSRGIFHDVNGNRVSHEEQKPSSDPE